MSGSEEVIASAKNASLKRVRAALRGKEPGLMVLEGRRLVEEAHRAGVAFELVIAEQRAAEGAPAGTRLARNGILDALGGVKTSSGLVGLARIPQRRGLEELRQFCAAEGPLAMLVVAGVADPGNLGALARSAEAFGCAGVVIAEGGARPFGSKALRGSMGSLLRMAVFEVDDLQGAADAFRAAEMTSFAAATRGGKHLEGTAFPERAALWISGETGEGLGRVEGLIPVTIEIAPQVESLNAAVAGSLLLHAAARQRGAGTVR